MQDDFVGTMPVQERHRFDVSGLESYLRQHVEGFSGPLEVEQFKGGQSNPTFMLKAGGQRYVLRRKPPGKAGSAKYGPWSDACPATAPRTDSRFRSPA